MGLPGYMAHDSSADILAQLHKAPEILRVVNVWDAITAKVVAELPETKALATAGHSIAASHGYEDGEKIPLELALQAIERIVNATELPVSADLDAGFGDPADTVRKAIQIGVAGANIEDQLKPLAEATASVSAIVKAAESEGVDFQLNARTDAFVLGGDRPVEQVVEDAISRGQAYLEAGASLVFVPGPLNKEVTEQLVAAFGPQKLSVIGLPVPGVLTAKEYEELGVARISYGPWTQRYALTALQDLASSLYGDGVIPEQTRPLN